MLKYCRINYQIWKKESVMRIFCGVCHEVFKGDDLIKIDFINTLTHYTCLDLGIDLIKNIDTFGNIKMEYPFLSE